MTCTDFQIEETFFTGFHSGLVWIQTDIERETGAGTSFRKIKVNNASADRQVERDSEKKERETDVCVFFLYFVGFFTLGTCYVFQSFA